jgi:hypothetical protein
MQISGNGIGRGRKQRENGTASSPWGPPA